MVLALNRTELEETALLFGNADEETGVVVLAGIGAMAEELVMLLETGAGVLLRVGRTEVEEATLLLGTGSCEVGSNEKVAMSDVVGIEITAGGVVDVRMAVETLS